MSDLISKTVKVSYQCLEQGHQGHFTTKPAENSIIHHNITVIYIKVCKGTNIVSVELNMNVC